MVYKYIDVSRYQGMIDWEKVKAAGVQGAFLKTVSTNYTEFGGLYIDPTFERNYAECKRLGIPVGAYYYTYALDKAYADKELALFRKAVDGKSFELPLVVDVEDNSIKKLTTDELTDLVVCAVHTIETWGAYAMVYTYTNYKNTELNMTRLANYDLWLADYTGSKPRGTYGIWQYTSNGNIDGVSGRCDVNRVYKNYPELIEGKFNDFTNGVVSKVYKPLSPNAICLVAGFASSGDIAKISAEVSSLVVESEIDDGFIYTQAMSSGDQVKILKFCDELGVDVKEYVPVIITEEAGNIIEKPETEPENDNWLIKLIKFIMSLFK